MDNLSTRGDKTFLTGYTRLQPVLIEPDSNSFLAGHILVQSIALEPNKNSSLAGHVFSGLGEEGRKGALPWRGKGKRV